MMAHALRYYKEIQQDNGQIIRLEIHKKDSTLPAVEIGRVLQALHLDIQGGADTIDAPIVKTSLTMTFVDAPDLEEGKKCGNWEEFYTPDSTMWKVVLKADGKTIWGGYVTPDSYQEDLRYRGSVTIIARDNIGHMQDFPFDMEGNAEGMVALQELVNEAWAKIESPMLLDWRHEADDAMYLLCDGVEAPQTYMNVSAFEDMNFFDAVEKALYSYGLVMRYTGSNRVTIMSLRDLPYQGKSGAPRAIEPTFIAHAQRELAPAARRIEESVKYDFSDGVQIPLAKGITFTGVAYTVPFYSTNVFGETTTKNIPVHAIANTSGEGWSNIPSSTLFFDPKKYTIRDTSLAEDAERMLFLACNTNGSHSAIYRKTVICKNFRISIAFGRPIERDNFGGVGYCYGFSDSDDREQNGIGSLSARSVDCYISREQNRIQQFFDGHTWSVDAVLLTIEVTDRQCGIDVPLGESSGTAEVTLTIVDVRLNDKWDFSDGLGLYIPISSMYWGVAQTASLCETNNVNTVYVNTNNVILEHSPELAPALDEVPFPSVIKNGIFVKSGNAYLPAKGWAWSGGTPQQMAVYNHLQLLCYHSKPNNIISGDIAYADFAEMEAIYEWGGANHLLVSGTYNFLNGRIESAVLREFKFYTDMWSDVSGTSLPDTEQNNRTTAESGSGAAKASTYSNETTVNIGGTGGGGTGGSSTLAGLLDVQVTSPSNGQALVYDSASGMWMNKTIEKGDKVTSSAIISALGYTPLNADQFTKANLGLGNVDNIAANKYFTALSSGTTNAVSMTIGGVTKNITATTLKTSLGLAGLAYQASVPAALGYTPFDKANFTNANIKSTLGISDWALEADRPSYSKSDVGLDKVDNLAAGDYFTALSSDTTNAISATIGGVTKNITATKLKTSLGLGAFAYLSKIPFTSITDVVVSNPSDGQLLSYDATRKGWVNKTFDLGEHISAGIIVDTLGYEPFDSDAFTKSNIKNALGIADWALAAIKPSYTWTEIGSRPTALSQFTNDLGLGSLAYKSSLAASDIPSLPWSKINSGKPTTLEGYGITGGSVSGALKAGSYDALQYFADGKLILHRNAGAANLYFNYGGAAEPMYLYGSMYGFHIGASRERAFTIDSNKDASFVGELSVAGNSYSKNYPGGKALSQDPTSAFISTIFDADAVSDSSYRMKILRSGSAYDRFVAAYSPVVAFKTGDTHGFISFGYNDAERTRCYIGGGKADKINWSGILFHDNMSLIPKNDGAFSLGNSDKRWLTLNAVNVSANGLFGYVPNGGTYQQYRVFYEGDKLYIQAGTQDGLSTAGKLTICGIYSATLQDFNIYSQLTSFSGAVKVSGTSRFVSLATFDNGLKIGDATLTWDASAGMLKIDKGVYSIGAITAGGKGQSNKYRLDNWTEWDASDNKWQESSLSAKLGVDLHTRILAIEESANLGPVKIDLEYIRNTTTLTPSQALTAGLTEDVINNMMAGKYTKVIYDNDAIEVWDYTAYSSGNSISIYLTNGDGLTLKSGIVIHRNSITDNWSVSYEEI